jgi:SAM-dependent methyltransferase
LELGCGHGLPGIFSLLHGANVTFQDYNSEVICQVTIGNIVLNKYTVEDSEKVGNVQGFYEGDWGSLNSLLAEELGMHSFDIILTSDTLYNSSSYPKLYSVIRDHLHPNGTAYIAAKSYYFGVGGSVSAFIKYVQEQEEETGIAVEIARTKLIDDGVSNIREILTITRKQ